MYLGTVLYNLASVPTEQISQTRGCPTLFWVTFHEYLSENRRRNVIETNLGIGQSHDDLAVVKRVPYLGSGLSHHILYSAGVAQSLYCPDYGLDDRGSVPLGAIMRFFPATASRLELGSIQPLIQ